MKKKKFGISGYKKLLVYLKKENLILKGFKDNLLNGRNLILRHDIDFCPIRALNIAKLENKMSMSSTFFFLINTDFYNLYSKKNIEILKRIIELGHEVGLHFDASLYNEEKMMHKACKKELTTLENIISKKINIISFHRPAKKFLNLNKKIAGRDHTYMKKFIKDINYCSDSQGIWRFKSPQEIIEENKNKNAFTLHLLTHPIWWTTPATLTPEEKIEYHLSAKHFNNKKLAAINCKPYSRFLNN